MAEPEVFHPLAATTLVKVFWQLGVNNCMTTLAYRWAGGTTPTLTELQNLAQAVWDGYVEKARTAQHSSVVYRSVQVYNADTPSGLTYTLTPTTPKFGARLGGAVAGNEAGRIFRKSSLRGRSKRGAISVSGFAEGDVDGNSHSSALISMLANIALEMLVAYVAGRFLPAIPSEKLGSSSILASTGNYDSNIDSQKTRLNGRGA